MSGSDQCFFCLSTLSRRRRLVRSEHAAICSRCIVDCCKLILKEERTNPHPLPIEQLALADRRTLREELETLLSEPSRRSQRQDYLFARQRRTPGWADQRAIDATYAEAAKLSRQTRIPHEVDHIVPLRGKLVSGLHCEANLRIIPSVENRKKRNVFETE